MFTWEIRSKADILPTTQGILGRMAAKRLDQLFSIDCTFAAILSDSQFRV